MDYTQISKQARKNMRDTIICLLMGLQADIGHYKSNTIEYQTLQQAIEQIEKCYGEYGKEIK